VVEPWGRGGSQALHVVACSFGQVSVGRQAHYPRAQGEALRQCSRCQMVSECMASDVAGMACPAARLQTAVLPRKEASGGTGRGKTCHDEMTGIGGRRSSGANQSRTAPSGVPVSTRRAHLSVPTTARSLGDGVGQPALAAAAAAWYSQVSSAVPPRTGTATCAHRPSAARTATTGSRW
jgi:hypothetical protein